MDGLTASYLLNFVLPLWLVTASPAIAQEETVGPPAAAERVKVVDGVEVRYGVVPAARAVRAHQQNPGGERAHGGTPSLDAYHVDVTLFDAASRARIPTAKVWATVRELNTAGKRKRLEAESFGGAVSYGNYFAIKGEGPFRIVVEAEIPGRKEPIQAEFDYRNR